MMEKVKRMRGKSPLEQMLNDEYLFVKDPDNLAYAEAMSGPRSRAGFRGPPLDRQLIFQTNNARRRPRLQTYLLLKDSYKALGQYDKAVAACQRVPHEIRQQGVGRRVQEPLGRADHVKGNYNGQGDFPPVDPPTRRRRPKLLPRTGSSRRRITASRLWRDARKAYAREPELAKNVFTLAETLADLENDKAETKRSSCSRTPYPCHEFPFKERAGLLRLRQLRRKLREAKKQH